MAVRPAAVAAALELAAALLRMEVLEAIHCMPAVERLSRPLIVMAILAGMQVPVRLAVAVEAAQVVTVVPRV
jgi:hypothetical protein